MHRETREAAVKYLVQRKSTSVLLARNFTPGSIMITRDVRAWPTGGIREGNRPDIGLGSLCSVTSILAVYNEFPLDCIAITGKQIAPSISQIAGSGNEISQSVRGLPLSLTLSLSSLLSVCAPPLPSFRSHAHDGTRARAHRPTHVRAFQAVRTHVTHVGECTSSAVELAARGSSRMNQPGYVGDFCDRVMGLNNR